MTNRNWPHERPITAITYYPLHITHYEPITDLMQNNVDPHGQWPANKEKIEEKLNDFGEEGSDLLVPFLFHW